MAQAVFYLFLLIRISAGDEINAQNIDDGNIQEKLKIIFKILQKSGTLIFERVK